MQGRLDSLCSIYAGINLMRLGEDIPSDESSAWVRFQDLITEIPEEDDGNIDLPH